MTFKSFFRTKRVPVSVGILLCGVAFAGFIANFIEAPVGSDEYLHDHLVKPVVSAEQNWTGDLFQIASKDRQLISGIVSQVEQGEWAQSIDTVITGQALSAAKEATCKPANPCDLVFRLGREFSEAQTNKDLRVTNVEETSLRATFKSDPEAERIALESIEHETRLFRFYQTQNGWVQKTSEVLDTTPLDFEDRIGKFDVNFSTDFAGVNYYPASASWKDFWTEFPVSQIKSDLEILQKINVNSVRIFLNHDYFSDVDTQSDANAKLKVFLDICAAKDIKVLVTLFDLRPDYTLSNLKRDAAHIDQLLAPVSEHPAILGVDIKNQADLDFPSWGQGVVEGWLTVMARHIQIHYPDLPVTVGWSNPNSALGLKDVVDFVTYHEYGNVDGFADRLESIKSQVQNKPVMITELGSTIWSPFRSTTSAELKQAKRLEKQLAQSTAANGVFVWTLNDFDHVGSDIVGRRPWRKAQQRHFGLIRADGSARPAKDVLQAHSEKITAQSIN